MNMNSTFINFFKELGYMDYETGKEWLNFLFGFYSTPGSSFGVCLLRDNFSNKWILVATNFYDEDQQLALAA